MQKLLRNLLIASALIHSFATTAQTPVVTAPTDNQTVIQPPNTNLTVSGSGNFSANNLFVGNGYITSNPFTDLLLQSGQTGTLTLDVWSYGQGLLSGPPLSPTGNQAVQSNYYGSISALLPGSGNGDFIISDADAQLSFFCADTTNDFVGVGSSASNVKYPGSPFFPISTAISSNGLPNTSSVAALQTIGLPLKPWTPSCNPPYDIFDVSNREVFGNGYMHWFAFGAGPTTWNAGISNPTSGTLSFDTTTDGNAAATIQVGSILFPDGSTQSSASQVGSNGSLTVQSPTLATLTVQSSAALGSTAGSVLSLVGNARTWNLESFNDANPGVYPGSLAITDGNSNLVRQLFDPAGDVYIGVRTGDGTITSSSLSVLANGNIGVAMSTPGSDLASLSSPPNSNTPIFEVNGDIALSQNTSSQSTGGQVIFSDGTVQNTAWNGTTLGGDYAESVDVSGDRTTYGPGDVIVINDKEAGVFDKSSSAYSRMVAGVYSTKPGLVGRRTTADRPDKDAELPMAMIGIVPIKVTTENGPIERGDLLVSSSKSGYAMKGTDRERLMGAVIGKALAPLANGTGLIEVLISLQ